jgi:hypothetical protein
MRRYLVFVLMVMLFGCAKNNEAYLALKQHPKHGLKSIATLSTKPLKEGESITVRLGDDDNEVIELGHKRTFAAKLLVPKQHNPFGLDVYSSSASGFFAPLILLLDQNNHIVHRVTARDLRFDRGYFKGTVFINQNYDKVSAIVVAQDTHLDVKKRHMHRVDSTPMVISAGPYMFTYISATGDQNVTLESAEGGVVELTLKPYRPATVEKSVK